MLFTLVIYQQNNSNNFFISSLQILTLTLTRKIFYHFVTVWFPVKRLRHSL